MFWKLMYHLYIDSFRVESSTEETVMILKGLVEGYKKIPSRNSISILQRIELLKIKYSLDMKFSWKLPFPKGIPVGSTNIR